MSNTGHVLTCLIIATLTFLTLGSLGVYEHRADVGASPEYTATSDGWQRSVDGKLKACGELSKTLKNGFTESQFFICMHKKKATI
jgi:hypothetical protein